MRNFFLLFLSVLLISAQAQESDSLLTVSKSAPPLFETDDALEIVLKTDINTLFKDREDERSYHPGTITYTSDTGEKVEVPLKLRVRGNFRRKSGVCRIPPIRLNFASATSKGTIFDGQDKLKLVTHCQKTPAKYSQYLLQEYLAYRMYNLVSDYSFKVRLVKIVYEDEAGKWKPMDTYAFIIEDEDALASRYDRVIKDQKNLHPASPAFDAYNTTLLSVFEYAIGNTDWSIPGLHNVKLLEGEKTDKLIAVPYDFDWCGIVNAPYAVPNEILGLSDVKTRLYRGYEREEVLFTEVFAKFTEKKEEIFALYENCPGLMKSQIKLSHNYLSTFYRIIENPKISNRNIISAARSSD